MKEKSKSVITVTVPNSVGRVVKKSVSFITNGCKYYFNAQHHFLKLQRGERAFFDFLCEKMDSGNRVTVDSALKDEFIAFIRTVTSETVSYKASSLAQYTQKLKELGLIISEGSGTGGYYIVNPKYAYGGTESSRIALLKRLIETRIQSNKSIQALIDRPEADFFSLESSKSRKS